MKLNRDLLRKMILNEIRLLNESKKYSELDPGEKSYAILGYLLDYISKEPLEKRADYSQKFFAYQADLKKAGDDGRLYKVGVDGDPKLKGVHNKILKHLQPGESTPEEISKYLDRGKNTRISKK
jgi:hypothetical protein